MTPTPNSDTLISELFDDLLSAASLQHVRRRYSLLRRILLQGMDAQLKGLRQVFPDTSSKMLYLIREHHLRQTEDGKRLAMAVNAARTRMRRRDPLTDDQLAAAFPFDQKAVCMFLARIYEANIPAQLASTFPDGWLEEGYHQRAVGRDGKAIDSLRCSLDTWDDQHLFVTLADDGRQMTVDYGPRSAAMGDWSYLKPLLRSGLQLNLVRPRQDGGVLLPELIILNPDSLISVTNVAGCFQACGISPYWEIIRKIKPRPLTSHILLGNLAGQFLDESAYGRQTTYADSVRRFFQRNALDIAACEGLDNTFHTAAKRQRDIIEATMQAGLHLKGDASLKSEEMILEPSFFCETLGLQGRMDFIHLNMATIVEQKSGKAAWGSTDEHPVQQEAHYVQLLLYRAIFHYAYGKKPYDEIASSLFYSKYSKGLLELGNAPQLLFEAIKMRNQLAWLEMHCAEQGFGFLPRLTPRSVCPKASGVLWERYVGPQLTEVLAPFQTASPLELAYCLRFMQFVACEQMLAKMGNFTKEDAGFATLWNCSIEEKRQAGCIYEQLVMDAMDACAEQEDVGFTFTTQVDADTSNFRVGDIVIFYPYQKGQEPAATSTIVFRCTLTAIRPDGVEVRLRNPQNSRVFDFYNAQDCLWAVEHDFMEASYDAQYRGISAFLSATKSRRDLLLGQRSPQVDSALQRKGDYRNGDSEEFNDLVQHVVQAQDLYLIIGPPGTGKTSFGMLNVLKEQLLTPNASILLMAYTNRAVDEMCSKLIAEGIDFVRLGSDTNSSPECHEHLLDRRMAVYNKVDDIRRCVRETHVFCGTTTAFNSHSQLFALKSFDLAIIDEASQLLEPDLIGLLSAQHEGGDAIRKFVLIGDDKQLPAVVQQMESVSCVKDNGLQAIGLTDCRLSLFERLLRMHGRNDESFCHLLTHQGRMHPDIADFPSLQFYNGKLCAVPLSHQQGPIPQGAAPSSQLAKLLASHRVAFLSYTQLSTEDESDKVNRQEACLIAEAVRHCQQMLAGEHPTVGIIVPYRNQISTVRSTLQARDAECHAAAITIDTVERYQGSERDIIVYGFTAKHAYQLDFLSANDYEDEHHNIIDRKLNVAMTRARKLLVLVGNAQLLSRDKVFRKLIDYCKCKGAFLEF